MAVAASGRDLLTDDDGRGTVVAAVRIDLRAEFKSGIIDELAADPADPRLASLVGVSMLSRFRDAVDAALPGETTSHSVRNQLFDDLPLAFMMSGRVLRVAGIPIEMARERTLPTDICAGWATGGTLLAGYTELGPPAAHRSGGADAGARGRPARLARDRPAAAASRAPATPARRVGGRRRPPRLLLP